MMISIKYLFSENQLILIIFKDIFKYQTILFVIIYKEMLYFIKSNSGFINIIKNHLIFFGISFNIM
jgi:hypothetical protein